ncbi:arsenate reductase (glutaredoxin) [Solitalea koreensis]|uniref:Arsenate reductase n=1 Tax=Solitalea koreensis TaxID=543615 RepID=A0A521B0W5_9SPHI|nr:arsenate reductase (glutaredoxin) [Solitalea koreensis]SMO40754.1 arsenate reductase [Solitalea koreensis]
MKILHNPRCSKSREALKLLEEKGVKPEVIKYMDDHLSLSDLKNIIDLLRIKPVQLVRTKESFWKENFAGKNLSDDEIVQAMIDFPQLMERPIVIEGDRAIIGRPTEKVIELLP